jgi:type II secretory pathway pseudopilin PulG
MEILVVLAVLAVAVAVIAGPLRRQRATAPEAARTAEREELEAAKEAKLREIREAQLDHRLGKLSREDWAAMDAVLRREAIELLQKLDDLEPSEDPRET